MAVTGRLDRDWILDPSRTDSELDEVTATQIMGWDYVLWERDGGVERRHFVPNRGPWTPTTDHTHAFELLDHVGLCFRIRGVAGQLAGNYAVYLFDQHDPNEELARASFYTLPRAITLAVLLWKAL